MEPDVTSYQSSCSAVVAFWLLLPTVVAFCCVTPPVVVALPSDVAFWAGVVPLSVEDVLVCVTTSVAVPFVVELDAVASDVAFCVTWSAPLVEFEGVSSSRRRSKLASVGCITWHTATMATSATS